VNLSDTHVLITGGSKGIGAAAATALRGRGARLTLVARESDELHRVAGAVGGLAIPTDLTDATQFADLVARAESEQGPLDVLVNNAALGASRHFGTLTAEDVRRTLTVNLLAPMELARQAVRSMVPRGHGAIVNVSSLAGELAFPNLATYGPSKAGLTMFSLDLQRDIRGSGVDVTAFVLGAVPNTGIYNESTLDNEVIQRLAAQLERFTRLTPQQIARRMVKTLESDRQGIVSMPLSSAPAAQIRVLPSRLGDLVFARRPMPAVDLTKPASQGKGVPG
jgi:short-subunit dehydrogenase